MIWQIVRLALMVVLAAFTLSEAWLYGRTRGDSDR